MKKVLMEQKLLTGRYSITEDWTNVKYLDTK